MRDLLGKLTSLDPDVRESAAGRRVLRCPHLAWGRPRRTARAAAVLAGVPAAAEIRGKVTAYDPDGHRLAEAADENRGSLVEFRLGSVWLERAGKRERERRDDHRAARPRDRSARLRAGIDP
ncbi:hypothetical protein IOD13_04095 [Brevibacterium casei]|nr:hypothetical protein [Brevibacterium casei]